MSLEVVRPGLLTTMQDLGRNGYRKYGVTVGGAMDPFALRAANLLVGNGEGEAALEITLDGPALKFHRDALIALCGGDLSPSLDGAPVPMWRPVWVREGGVLRFGVPGLGCRAYLAVAGGFDAALVMGSRSTDLRAALGGWKGRRLQAGDVVGFRPPSPLSERIASRLTARLDPGQRSAAAPWRISADLTPRYGRNPAVRALPGPEWERFDAKAREAFWSGTFSVSPASDRMGYRLSGPALRLAEPFDMISEAVSFGTVQVPPDGNPIVLMADRQTTGGYPRIAQVIAVDLPVMAQVSPGRNVRFRPVALEEAEKLLLVREAELLKLKAGIEAWAASA